MAKECRSACGVAVSGRPSACRALTIAFCTIPGESGPPLAPRNSGSSGSTGQGQSFAYFATASRVTGSSGTIRCLPPLPVTCRVSPSGTSRPVSESASAIRNPDPYIRSITARSRAPIQSSAAVPSTKSAIFTASSGVTGRGRPFLIRGPRSRGALGSESPDSARANAINALSAESSRAALVLARPSARRAAR